MENIIINLSEAKQLIKEAFEILQKVEQFELKFADGTTEKLGDGDTLS